MSYPENHDIYNGVGDAITAAGGPDILVGPIDYSTRASVAAIVELNGEQAFELDERFDGACG